MPIQQRTEQENFWAGAFGDAYIDRNQGETLLACNIALFGRILQHTGPVRSILELGANIGLNLMALQTILPNASLAGVEINAKAAAQMRTLRNVRVYEQSIHDFKPDGIHDLVFTKGVLIHLNPDLLPEVYGLLYQSASRFILVIEYYNPSPVEVSYRSHQGKLFKRDFAGELLARFPDLSLSDYGFAYRKDPLFPQDDLTWFLLRKPSRKD